MYLHFRNITYLFKYGTCFKGVVPPFSTNSRLPTSPDGVVGLPPSGGWRMNFFLLKTSQGRISKFISWSISVGFPTLSFHFCSAHSFEIPPCDVLSKKFSHQMERGTRHQERPAVENWLKMGVQRP